MHEVFNDCKEEVDKILVHFLVHLLLSSCGRACRLVCDKNIDYVFRVQKQTSLGGNIFEPI